jgi:hypothetical protein
MQPKLFEKSATTDELEKVLLYALGDFQSRGKVLAERELAFDRLRGAFLRAFEKFGVEDLPDRVVAESLEKLGARVASVPTFVAKHPFRVTVSEETAQLAKTYYAGFSRANVKPKNQQPTA